MEMKKAKRTRRSAAQGINEVYLSLASVVERADPNSALIGLTLVASAFSLLLQTYALPNANNPEGMCDSPDLFRRHFAEIVATAVDAAKAENRKS